MQYAKFLAIILATAIVCGLISWGLAYTFLLERNEPQVVSIESENIL